MDQALMVSISRSPVFISRLIPVLPTFEVEQEAAAHWLTNAFRVIGEPTPERAQANKKMYERLAKRTNIEGRRTVLMDYTTTDVSKWQWFQRDGKPSAPQLTDRMQIFADSSLELARQAYASCDFNQFERVFLVSCTGYDSPSMLQRLLPGGWSGEYTMLGHMGCYAALPAVGIASDALLSGRKAGPSATIFLCEFCTLHLDPLSEQTEQQVINMLFADGAIRLDLTTDPDQGVFELVDRFEFLVPDTVEQMTWRPGTQNFAMTLSAEVPIQIQKLIRGKVEAFLAAANLKVADVKQWAIHPGGIKIIEPIADTLGVSSEKIAASLKIYRSRGNMSSTTVPHIWQLLASDPTLLQSGDFVMSMAFGPGLTIVGNLMRRC